jgi:hypothetical protein
MEYRFPFEILHDGYRSRLPWVLAQSAFALKCSDEVNRCSLAGEAEVFLDLTRRRHNACPLMAFPQELEHLTLARRQFLHPSGI